MTTKPALHPRPFSIGRPADRLGHFEVHYPHGEGYKSCCLVAYGFQDAIDRFEELKHGPYAWIREITQAQFEAWFEVSLNAAQTLDELRSGVHL